MQKSNQPKQYQLGYCEFYKLKFKLTPDVLIPRPETELLVEEVLSFSRKLVSSSKPDSETTSQRVTILDLGTGSGCIAISIAKNLPGAKIIATDISKKALEIAKLNAKFHKVEKQIFFLESNLLEFIKDGSKTPDIITANLPYIPTASLMMLDPMVRDFEPKIALDGGRDGFELYRKLFAQMSELFASQIVDKKIFPKFLIIEIDNKQAEVALAESRKYFPQAKGYIKMDLAKLERFLLLEF